MLRGRYALGTLGLDSNIRQPFYDKVLADPVLRTVFTGRRGSAAEAASLYAVFSPFPRRR
jgi:truncated hemoglobin YjbI